MRIALTSPVRRYTFLIGCGASLALAWAFCLQAIAEHWLQAHPSPEHLARAVHLQPLDAALHEELGVLSMDPAAADFQQARLQLETAAAINPHSSRAWLHLSNAYAVLGDDDRHAEAVRRALASEPRDTQVQWEAANLFLDTDLDRSLQLLRGVVENDPQYAPAATQVAYRASGNNIDKAMLAIPLTVASRLQLMHWLLERNEYVAADRVWPTLVSSPGEFSARDAFFYLDSLIARHQVDSAAAAWAGVVQKDPGLRSRVQPDNFIMNGDFEGDLLNGGFGWRYVPTSGVAVTLDTSTFHGGTRSLALQIDGENLQDFGLRELVKVEPGGEYRINGWLHAEELEAAHGIRLAIADAYSHAPLLLMDDVLGSFPWRQLDGSFKVPPDTHLVEVTFVRSPANGRIRGKLWADDLRIEKR